MKIRHWVNIFLCCGMEQQITDLIKCPYGSKRNSLNWRIKNRHLTLHLRKVRSFACFNGMPVQFKGREKEEVTEGLDRKCKNWASSTERSSTMRINKGRSHAKNQEVFLYPPPHPPPPHQPPSTSFHPVAPGAPPPRCSRWRYSQPHSLWIGLNTVN